MRLTTEQRITALERDNIVLHDTIKLLHKLLKEQRQLINDYITRSVLSAREDMTQGAHQRPEDAVYTFVCTRRFEAIERHMKRIHKLVEDNNSN